MENLYATLFDLAAAVVLYAAGLWMYRSKMGEAADKVAAFRALSPEEKERYDKVKICKVIGVRVMMWGSLFVAGGFYDSVVSQTAVGTAVACLLFVVALLWHRQDLKKNFALFCKE